jgi:NitT/TauT family transport system substrate-binding protein
MAPPPRSSTWTRRRFLTAAGLSGAALALGACGRGPTADGPAAEGVTATGSSTDAEALAGRTIRVAAFTNSHAASPLFWPQFAPEGVEVEVTTLSSGTDMNQALASGDLDFAVFGIVNGFVEHLQGLDSRIVAMGARQGAGLVVRSDSDFAQVADLAGARVGFKGPAFQSLTLFTLLEEAGLDPDRDVELVPVEWGDMPTALEAGDVDAFMGTEPNPSRVVASGLGRRLVNPYTTPIGQLNSTVWASGRVVEEEPEVVRAAVAMQRGAAELLSPGGANDPAVWEDLVVGQYGFEPEVYRELLGNVGAVWELTDFWVDQARAAGAKMAELGVIDTEPDYDTVIRTDFMPSAS